MEPLVVSWGWRPTDPGPSRFIDEQERQATKDPAAYLTVPAAIAYQAEHDWPRVRQECHALVRQAREGILELTGEEAIAADDPRWFAQMAAMTLPECDTEALKSRLWDEYRIEIPVGRGQRPRIRISVQGYNTRTDIERLLEALTKLLPQVR